MTRKEKIKLCGIYNCSDIEALLYMKKFVTEDQKELLERMIYLNQETKICDGDKDYTPYELKEYFDGKWKLLHSFGLENNHGDAEFEGVFYQGFHCDEEVMSHQPSANEDYFEEMNDYEDGTMNV